MGATGISKVVFPVAGLGTRFLPATKAIPKEMLPLVDKPLIQYAAEEAVAAGARTLIFVTGRFEQTLVNYFGAAPELEAGLRAGNKPQLLERIQRILPSQVECIYVNQPDPKGLGDAVYRARGAVGDAPFGVILPDDQIQAAPPGTLARMAGLHAQHGAAVVAVEAVPREHVPRYGIVASADTDGPVMRVDGVVEKPPPDLAPSNLAVVGRYILPARIFDLLERAEPGAGGEIQLTDAIAALLHEHPVLAYRFPGKRFDCGSKAGFVQATVSYALEHSELRCDTVEFLKSLALNGR